jgi:hypothetical protein
MTDYEGFYALSKILREEATRVHRLGGVLASTEQARLGSYLSRISQLESSRATVIKAVTKIEDLRREIRDN